MGMLVTILLISITIYISSSTTAPPDRGLSYIEIWMFFGNLIPILLTLLEYAYILYKLRIEDVKCDIASIDIYAGLVLSFYFVLFHFSFWSNAFL